MFEWHVLSALSIGVIISIIFALSFHRRLHWSNAWIFFIVTFLGAWAGGVWIPPFGPTILNVHWLPFLLAGIVMGLLMLAASVRTHSPRDHTKDEASLEEEAEFSGEKLSGIFIWTLLAVLSVGLIAAIVVGYVITQ